ncbi:MAG: hypothetical protein A2Y82_03380 [Candidatus Buchananbacteria bacterium RBG_13_36_9]|uniref:Uncharacterized protein n=1 Tax=Candidatus Buchananbacteria bacterium RBG_13_36_9 TaxID=1797530 RepID=A0A1G1XLJ7_9BACT|nr:MAG: hypothetical protein A2Y82_03380 [Candidatus Buchananbacteria bacterium RBG_13_36_9]
MTDFKNDPKKVIPAHVLLEKRIKKIIADQKKKGSLLFPLAEISKAQLNLFASTDLSEKK